MSFLARYRKAILAGLTGGLGQILVALDTPGWTTAEIVGTISTALIAGGATLHVSNKGFLDLSSLTPAQRTELGRFLNL